MKIKENVNTSEFLFFISWFLFLSSYFLLKQSEIMYMFDTSNIFKLVKIIVASILLLKMIIIDKYSFQKYFLYYIVLGLSFVNSILVDSDMIFFIILVAFSAHNIDFKKFLKFDIKIRLFFILSIILLCLVGVLPNFTREINGSFKQGFGFSHPNVFCLNVITLLLEVMYLNKKFSFKYLFFNILIVVLLMHFCNARTSIYTYSLIFIVNLLIRDKEKIFNKKYIKRLLYCLPIIMLILSIFFVKQYGYRNPKIIKLDQILTTRISNGYSFYKTYGITLFGTKIETVGTRKALITGEKIKILDMGYLRLAINNGIIECLIFIGFLCVLQFLIYRRKDYKLLLLNLFFIIIGLLETNIYNIAFNIVFISFVDLFTKRSEPENVEGMMECE